MINTNQVQDQKFTDKAREAEKIFIRQIVKKQFWACFFSGIPKTAVSHIKSVRLRWDFRNKNNVVLEYNPDFILSIYKISPLLLEFYIAHEGAHLLLKHMLRWNIVKEHIPNQPINISEKTFHIAADLAVNSLVLRSLRNESYEDRMTVEKYVRSREYFPEQFNLQDGLSTEMYLSKLLSQNLDLKEQKSNHTPSTHTPENVTNNVVGDRGSIEGGTPSSNHVLKTSHTENHVWDLDNEEIDYQNIDSKSIDGNDLAPLPTEGISYLETTYSDLLSQKYEELIRTVGKMPGNLIEHFPQTKIISAPISWKGLLRNHIKRGKPADDDMTYGRWNNRLWHLRSQGILPLPGTCMGSGWRLVVIEDTSGSMSPENYRECLEVSYSLVKFDRSLEMFIAQADTDVRHVYQVKKASDIKTTWYGRGGTNFTVPIYKIEKEYKPDLIIYCTDGYGDAPVYKPKTPIIWCMTENHQIPARYGRVVVMSTGKVLR